MPASSLPAPSREDLLAGLDRLSQGRGPTYGERTRLADTPDPAFVEAQIEALEAQRRWQPLALGGIVLLGVALLLLAGGATPDPATWPPALPSGPLLLLLLLLPAFATPFLKHRALSQKLGIYRALRAMAAPSQPA